MITDVRQLTRCPFALVVLFCMQYDCEYEINTKRERGKRERKRRRGKQRGIGREGGARGRRERQIARIDRERGERERDRCRRRQIKHYSETFPSNTDLGLWEKAVLSRCRHYIAVAVTTHNLAIWREHVELVTCLAIASGRFVDCIYQRWQRPLYDQSEVTQGQSHHKHDCKRIDATVNHYLTSVVDFCF